MNAPPHKAEFPPAPAVFTESEIEGLPAPAQRYLRAAIAPGTPLAVAARLRMRGQIKVGRWVPFHAREDLAPLAGFRWTAAPAASSAASTRTPRVGARCAGSSSAWCRSCARPVPT